MAYNFRRFLKITYLSFFKTEGTLARLSPKRILVLIVFYTLYVIVEVSTWISFLLDDIFFPNYRKREVEQPLFIVGNPRSGTTFLHRLIAKDEANFTSLRLWQILFAPSVTQRKIGKTVAGLDRKLGGALHKILFKIDRGIRASNVMHRISLLIPEEDEYLMIHCGSTIISGLFFGFPREAYPFVYFDQRIPKREKRRDMRFYRHCLQRHLHAHDIEGKHILSKNPYFTPKVDALYRRFPDAKIIYLARNPLKVIPSYASLSAHWWRLLCEPEERYPHMEYVLTATQHWYRYPVDRLEEAPEENRIFVNFHDLVADPDRVVHEIYDRFDLEMTPEFEAVLKEETEKAKNHKSRHKYSLEAVGLTHQEILTTYSDVFERWGFDREIE